MKARIVKVNNIEHLSAEINEYENSGYKVCDRNDNATKIIFKEQSYYKRQKTVYFI